MGNLTNQKRIDALEILKDLPTQVQSDLCALEERMEERLLKSQESLKDSLALMILEGQNRVRETLKKKVTIRISTTTTYPDPKYP